MREIHTEQIVLHVHGHPMGAYLARPADTHTPRPAIIVCQEIFGVNSHIRDVTERIAREGYIAIAPDYFWRVAPSIELSYTSEGVQKGMTMLRSLKAHELLDDLDAVLAFLQERADVKQGAIGSIGFCIGGHIAYLLACERPMRATASFYGGGIATFCPGGGAATVTHSHKIQGELVCFFGARDAAIPREQIETIRKALQGKKNEIVVYPDAEHGFFCDQRASFHESSRDDAWQRVLTFFGRVLSA